MNQTLCDKCKRLISDGLNDRPFVWHRSIPNYPEKGHFDLCESCDGEVMSIINSPDTVAYLP